MVFWQGSGRQLVRSLRQPLCIQLEANTTEACSEQFHAIASLLVAIGLRLPSIMLLQGSWGTALQVADLPETSVPIAPSPGLEVVGAQGLSDSTVSGRPDPALDLRVLWFGCTGSILKALHLVDPACISSNVRLGSDRRVRDPLHQFSICEF